MRDNVKYTSKKMWHVANLVRGLSVDEALKQLDFINKKGAFIAAEVIREAQELAVYRVQIYRPHRRRGPDSLAVTMENFR